MHKFRSLLILDKGLKDTVYLHSEGWITLSDCKTLW